jgi:5-methylcytosine-specific restriction protein A
MTHYLLKWNPENWPQERFREYFEKFERGESLSWSCGNTKKIQPGDRFYLIKNGKGDRGIIGSGVVLSAPYESKHYDEAKAKDGQDALFVDVEFDYLVKPDGTIPVLRSELNASHLA